MYNNTATDQCNTIDYPMYDPDYFDQECSNYYWCFRYYDSRTCAPESFSGYTEEQVEWIYMGIWYAFYYVVWLFVGIRVIPFCSCLILKYFLEDFADDIEHCRLFADFWYDAYDSVTKYYS